MNLPSYLHCNYSNSLTLSNEGKLSRNFIPENHIQDQKERENFAVACLRPPLELKLGIFISVMAKKYTKKCAAYAELLFCV